MKAEKMELQAALSKGKSLPWAMIRSLSTVTLGPPPSDIPEDDLLEARFFSPDEEIRIFRNDGKLHAVLLRDEKNDEFLDHTYRISNPELGTEITVRSYLGFDDDGQAYLKNSRLTNWKQKGGPING